MIIFLTLCYVAVLFLLVKLRVLPDNLFVRLSPIGFMLLLFLFLFVPMQWGAPGGPAVVIRAAVSIVPNVCPFRRHPAGDSDLIRPSIPI